MGKVAHVQNLTFRFFARFPKTAVVGLYFIVCYWCLLLIAGLIVNISALVVMIILLATAESSPNSLTLKICILLLEEVMVKDIATYFKIGSGPT